MIVTPQRWPLVYEALEDISHDGGGRAGHLGYNVPMPHADSLNAFEQQLSTLNLEQRETLAIGEQTEQEELVRDYGLEALHQMLDAFFNDGMRWCSCCEATPG